MRLLLFNKPFRCLSQFTDTEKRATLARWIDQKGIYPAGRLDFDSEGLLLLTDHGGLQAHISDPKYKLEKIYLVQVEGSPSEDALGALRTGVKIKGGLVHAGAARSVPEPPPLWPRTPPVRYRKSVPDHWIELMIDRGLNRQVRRMTAAASLPTLRLIRTAIGPWSLGELMPGQWRELSGEKLARDIKDLGWRLT
ncbi:MAG: pseudouridine synthase [Gammaproteobacteria bacterium]|nr:pseudouridine synthase [Gammaproteobacteria bacterium]